MKWFALLSLVVYIPIYLALVPIIIHEPGTGRGVTIEWLGYSLTIGGTAVS